MKKKAFTLVEMLVALVVTMIVMMLLIALLGSTFKIYNETTSEDHEIGYAIRLVSDVEIATRGCDFVEVSDANNKLLIRNGNDIHVIDANDYGIIAGFAVNYGNSTISIIVGGEEYCVNYIQNTPS